MLTQRDAVYNITVSVLKAQGINFVPGTTYIKDVAIDETRRTVIESLIKSFRCGEIALRDTEGNRAKLANDEKLKAYVSSLVSNHWKRDGQLNGKVK